MASCIISVYSYTHKTIEAIILMSIIDALHASNAEMKRDFTQNN